MTSWQGGVDGKKECMLKTRRPTWSGFNNLYLSFSVVQVGGRLSETRGTNACFVSFTPITARYAVKESASLKYILTGFIRLSTIKKKSHIWRSSNEQKLLGGWLPQEGGGASAGFISVHVSFLPYHSTEI